jgi:hypothetical protein
MMTGQHHRALLPFSHKWRREERRGMRACHSVTRCVTDGQITKKDA